MSAHRWFRWSEGDGWGFPRRSFRSSIPHALRRHVSGQRQLRALHLEEFERRVLPTFTLGAAANYAILFEGGSTNALRSNSTLHIANSTTNVTGSGPSQGGGIGNIGVGSAGKSAADGGAVLNGRIDFSAANTGQFSNNGANVISGGVNYNVSAVTSALNTVNALNATLGALPGTSPTINGNTTINASNGGFSASGPGYTNVRVFDITAFSLNNGQTLTINGDSNGDSVVFNFGGSTNFHGNVVLTGGLTPDKVIFNFVGGSNLTGGPTLDLNNGGGSTNLTQGIFLDPNGKISVGSSNVLGRVFGGDSQDFQFNGLSNLTAPLGITSPTLTTTPSPTAVTLGAAAPPILTDAATLSGGNAPTGTVTFTLVHGGTTVDTETKTVSGNGTFTTPTGYTLLTTGTVTGTYQWNTTYSGDTNNNTVSDNNAANEQVTVSAASPTLTTAPNPTTVTLGTTAVTLRDTADLEGGFHPTGSISFTLFLGNTLLDTETVPVTGNGMYTTPTGFTLPTTGTATGTYQWDATYNGNPNNNPVSDNNAANEQVTVSAASPTITTAPTPATVTLGIGTVTLTDTATLAGAFRPTGIITFTLFFNGGATPVDTETVAVNGNGTYTTPTGFTLPHLGAVTGTYQWDATYSGDTNNQTASDTNALNELVTVSAAHPNLTTTPNPTTVTLGATAPPTLTDVATLSGGFFPDGTITFTLFFSGSPTPVDTETVTVNGNGTYTTPTGFTLPSTGTVTGSYQWVASFDDRFGNNAPVTDANDPNERVTVSAANPTISTTPNPTSVPLGASAVTLTDTATLQGGFHPTGTITFTLFQGSTLVDTETVAVTGNGTYTTPTGFTLPTTGTETGTFQWDASYSGDTNNNTVSENNAANERVTVSAASPTISTVPSPTTVTLGMTVPPILTDAATLARGFGPTGSIIFTLFHNGGPTPVDTETVTVNGNGTYTTPTGFTLPTTGTVTGTYQWNASYSGDTNNNAISDTNAANEQVTVSASSPTLSTTPIPATVTLGTTAVTLKDTADLEGGFHPTGSITFTLFQGSTLLDTETVPVTGNGMYTTPTGFTLPAGGTVTGTYQWDTTYNGDTNNNTVSDNGATNERVTVSAASPTLTTAPNPTKVTLGTTAVTLKDTADLEGGFHPTGSISFTLFQGSTLLDTETVTVTGNGMYTTPTGFTLPASGTVTGTYQWDATYNGDPNNNPVSDNNAANERVTVSAASPTITTAPNPTTVTLGTTVPPILTDAATLAGGFRPTGSIIFTLFHNGGPTPVDTETVTVNGNGVYTTPTGFTLPAAGTATGTYQWNASYGGDPNNSTVSDNNAANERVTVSAASPTLVTAPSPTTVTLGATAPPVLTDAAALAGGFRPSGTITFTLFHNGGPTPVDTETVPVTGNGIYTTPTGFTLPTTGTATGAYQWDATYSGDTNNNTVSDNGATNEQVTVSAASPTISTAPNPTTVTLGTTPVTLNDSADLEGGFHPTGTIIFTLFHNGGTTPVDTEVVTVTGNGIYTTPTGFTLPTSGTVTGTFQWNATYNGDTNNGSVSDNGAANEQVTVTAASPTISTVPSPTTVTLGATPVTLNDTAVLTGGFSPSGTITFTLFHNGGTTPVDTEVVTVTGNGIYTTPTGFTLPATGPVTGTYQWDATYSGDTNNGSVSDDGAANERVTVTAASPTITTAPNPTTVTLGATAPPILTDAATLAGGFSPTGTITFTLFHNGGTTPVDTETVTVNGNGTYTTPTGFTLPSGGAVAGTYQWDATYSSDANNNGVSDTGSVAERVTVNIASPTLGTIPNPTAVTLGANPVTLTDTATLEGGFSPTGTITFTLFQGSTLVDTETVAVTGNGTYPTPTGFTLPTTGTVTGTYQWDASYNGDTNNNTASDNDAVTEQVTVSAASPTLTTTPIPTTAPVGQTLQDSALLTGGYHPTGAITFSLYAPGVDPAVGPATHTETVTGVNGNGTYETTVGFVSNATGIWHWVATYDGDSNNGTVSSGPRDEPVAVPAAGTTLTTAPIPTTVALGPNAVTLTDTATLAGGFSPTGTITFTLFHNGGTTPVDTETVAVNGNGTYPTPTGFTLPATGTVTGTYQWDATYSGDANNTPASDTGSVAEQVTVNIASPTLGTIPNPTAVTLGANPVTLTDTATLEGGFSPTGSIIFTLFHNGGTTPVDTETVTVNGNGTYTTPTGFTLPAAGTVTGTYQWDAAYSGDTNNNTVSDNRATNEQVTVSAASPTITTAPDPTTVTLGTTPVTLNDSADLEGGFHPTGTITFTLHHGGTPVDTETVPVTGNGIYTTPTGFTLPTTGTVTGTFQWDATYDGDTNNGSVSDNSAANEQVTVTAASPTITTAPNPTTVTLGATAPPILTDAATLAGGFSPTGTIIFTLFHNGGPTPVDTETVTVNGNGTYATPTGFTLPATGPVTGTYQWDATYSGDTNNNTVSENDAANEQVTVNAASPAISTTPIPTTVTLGATAPPVLTDAATLVGGFRPTGSIIFTLFHNGGTTPVDTETVTVTGNGTYTTPTGFTLPATGTVTGTYQWDATYNGDTNNNTVSDNGATNEQVTVTAASPTISTVPSPTTVTLGATVPPILTDAATLAGGFSPTGSIIFTLFHNGGTTPVDTETVTVNGNGVYTTPTGFTLPAAGTVTGTYQWDAAYSGDTNNNTVSDNDATNEQVTVSAASPTLVTAPSPTTVTLGATAPPILTDAATLSGGFRPSGTITFTLFHNGGPTPVDTETVPVSGNGTYSTPTGFTLPATGTVTGTYQWDATYNGDTNNNTVSDNGATNEQVTVTAASPTISTVPSPTTVTLGATVPPILTDAATLAGGFSPTGSIIFTLFHNGGTTPVDTETVTVNGNGVYTTPTGFTLPAAGTVTGTYQWDAAYSGDTNNNTVSDNDATNEQVTVSAASPTITTAPDPTTVTLGTTPVTLNDSADLEGGFHPTGTITFTLHHGGTPVDTETVPVTGNGIYTTPTGFTLPTTGTVTGTFQWDATYDGDTNNGSVSDNSAANEQVTVTAASPTITTAPNPTTVTLGATAPPILTDAATLAGGFSPTGSIIFTLFHNGGTTPVDTETVTVNGNGTYTTPTGFTLPAAGTVTGTYQWDAAYSGDTNNNTVSDNRATNEQVTVSRGQPDDHHGARPHDGHARHDAGDAQ